MEYRTRTAEAQVDMLLGGAAAISIEGAKAVGKTALASRRASTIVRLERRAELELVRADPDRLTHGTPPLLIDEWQRYPDSWDIVRAAVDEDRAPGRFLLTGSTAPIGVRTHSGAGRIVSVHLRPMTLPERGVAVPTVSLAGLLAADGRAIEGRTDVGLEGYADEIVASGLPGLRDLTPAVRRAELNGYLDRIVTRDFAELGRVVRNPPALRRWMTAYAAATATTASFESIRAAATSGEGLKPARTTVTPYNDVLETLRLVEPLPAWAPTSSHIARLSGPPKHHLADPALAARLLNVSVGALLDGADVGPRIPREGTLLSALFESLACLTVRVFAQAAGDARVFHFRTHRGEREVDLVVEGEDGRVIAIEVKLSKVITDNDTRHLRWLRERLGGKMADAVVISTGAGAYRRRSDGVAVVPLALLGA